MPHPLNEELLAGVVRAEMMQQACVMAIHAALWKHKARAKATAYLLGLYAPGPEDLKRAGVVVNPFNGMLRFKDASP